MDFAAINEGGYADHKYECVCPKDYGPCSVPELVSLGHRPK